MARSFFALASLLLACSALAAPGPKPFAAGWSTPVDPDKDCKLSNNDGTVIIEMPGTEHEYDSAYRRVNAPRILRDFEGDFDIQLRVRIDCRPSTKSTVKDQFAYVAGGFLVFPPDSFAIEFFRFQYGVAGEGTKADGFVAQLSRGYKGGYTKGACGKDWEKWPFKAKPEYVYLRLYRWGEVLSHNISPDGKSWVAVGGGQYMGLPPKLKVGLAAFSTSSDPSKVQFDQLKITQGKKRERWDFVSGWGNPTDPDKDCTIQREKDSLAIEMPGTVHDYDPVRKRFNAPRLLSELEGDFDLVVRVRIDYRPSAQSTVKDQPAFVSAGLLLLYPETERFVCVRMEYAVSQQGSRHEAYAVPPFIAEPRRKGPVPKDMKADSYAVKKTWFCMQRKPNKSEWDRRMPIRLGSNIWERGWQNWPLPEKADHAYLRLEQRDNWFCFFISPDGVKWTSLTYQKGLSAKGKVGLAAYSTSTEPSKVRFDQLKLWRAPKADGKKKAL